MKKISVLVLSIVGGLTIAAGVCLLTLTMVGVLVMGSSGFEWKYDEHQRRTSLDGRFDAIVLQGGAGVVSGDKYEIYILPRGSKVNRERHRHNCVFKNYEKSGEFSYLWKGHDLFVTVEETPIKEFWPYYFTEDAVGKRTREGGVYIQFKRE